MTLNSVYEILMAILPAITSVISIVGVALGILAKFKKLIDTIKDKTDQQEVVDTLKNAVEEDRATITGLLDTIKQLEIQQQELIDKIDKIKRS